MRVITGTARGMKLKAPEGTETARPTAEAVKEAMFSMIQFDIEDAVVLDLFAGTGQLGIEALSRGARKAYFVDNSPVSLSVVRENLAHTRLNDNAVVVNSPNSVFLKGTSEIFDIAILDPPYGKKLVERTLPALTEKMSENGIIICEHERECRLPEEVNGFKIYKNNRYGRICLTVYKRIREEANEE